MFHFKFLFLPSVASHKETSYFICSADKVTGFYMKCNTGLKYVYFQNSYTFVILCFDLILKILNNDFCA